MNRLLRLLARISIRILAFNLLLVFLPVAGILYLGTYEEHLVDSQRRSISDQAKIVAASLDGSLPLSTDASQTVVARIEAPWLGRPPEPYSARIRVVDPNGHVVADSYWLRSRETVEKTRVSSIRQSRLYRAGAFLARPVLRLIRPPRLPLEADDAYETSARLTGSEVLSALRGDSGSRQRRARSGSVTMYEAVPIRSGNVVTGAVLVSQSTYPIQKDVYAVRLGVLRIFVASVIVALFLSLNVATTIVRPLRQLRLEAGAILDRRGRLKSHFRGSRKLDEIGDLSRALERLTRRLDSHVRFIESFASDVSHEFKNPLASIRTATEMLAEVDEPQQRTKFRRMVEQDVARMENLLSAVRDITVIDAQLSRERREPIDLSQLLPQICDSYRIRVAGRVKVELEGESSPLYVEASHDRLFQLLENLIDNAISFSPDAATVLVRLAQQQAFASIEVLDEGPGIPEAHESRIFDRFFSYRPKEAKKEPHSGLGLAIVRAIVEGYGGSITATNRSAGGAVFQVLLPKTG